MSSVGEKEHESHLSYKMSLAAKCVSLHSLAGPGHNGPVSDIQFMIQNSFSDLIQSHPILKMVSKRKISCGRRRRDGRLNVTICMLTMLAGGNTVRNLENKFITILIVLFASV